MKYINDQTVATTIKHALLDKYLTRSEWDCKTNELKQRNTTNIHLPLIQYNEIKICFNFNIINIEIIHVLQKFSNIQLLLMEDDNYGNKLIIK